MALKISFRVSGRCLCSFFYLVKSVRKRFGLSECFAFPGVARVKISIFTIFFSLIFV